jgi:hypothetical protein
LHRHRQKNFLSAKCSWLVPLCLLTTNSMLLCYVILPTSTLPTVKLLKFKMTTPNLINLTNIKYTVHQLTLAWST